MTGRYVIDTSVLMQAYIEDVNSESVIMLLATLDQTDAVQLHYLDHGLAECGNVLWKRVRFKGLSSSQARTELQNLLSLPIEIHQSRFFLENAFRLALDNDLTVYDALHVVLAASLQCPLITSDVKQRVAAEAVEVSALSIKDVTLS